MTNWIETIQGQCYCFKVEFHYPVADIIYSFLSIPIRNENNINVTYGIESLSKKIIFFFRSCSMNYLLDYVPHTSNNLCWVYKMDRTNFFILE